MKLNYKRTILIGFAFFLICAFWQAYDATIPVILTNKFGMSQTWSGVIMALDNIFAVFLLPVFGALSDKCKGNRHGKRSPFIVVGTLVAALALVGLSFADNMQLQKINDVSTIDDPAALETIYDAQWDQELLTPEGDRFVLKDLFSREEFSQIRSTYTDENGKAVTNPEHTNFVAPARQAYVADITAANPGSLIFFVGMLLVVLLAMAVFRSPAVALMPDVTIKPLRSKANAVINLMGNAGGIVILVLGILLGTSKVSNQMMQYFLYYGIVVAIMLIALVIYVLTVREKAWAKQMQEDSIALGIEEAPEETGQKRGLSRSEKVSLVLILASVALWYFGYNAVTSKYAVYAGNILNMDYNSTLLIAQAFAIVSYLPAGMVASKFGRKKTILVGVVLLAVAFGAASFMRADSSVLVMNILFALAGIGWATINVNSFPMVVELCSGSDIGKYTGLYYTASMAAQAITPWISGYFMDQSGMTVLFPYATVFVGLALVTMLLVRHGDVKIPVGKGMETFDIED